MIAIRVDVSSSFYLSSPYLHLHLYLYICFPVCRLYQNLTFLSFSSSIGWDIGLKGDKNKFTLDLFSFFLQVQEWTLLVSYLRFCFLFSSLSSFFFSLLSHHSNQST
jgi:hypothetical protein